MSCSCSIRISNLDYIVLFTSDGIRNRVFCCFWLIGVGDFGLEFIRLFRIDILMLEDIIFFFLIGGGSVDLGFLCGWGEVGGFVLRWRVYGIVIGVVVWALVYYELQKLFVLFLN